MRLHIQSYKHHSSSNHHHNNINQFIKSHLSVWVFLCIMIHSSIILTITCSINLALKHGLLNPNSNIKEYTESWEKVGFKTLHLSLDLDLETRDKGEEIWTDLEQGNKRAARSDHHHQSAATTTTTTTRHRRGGREEREERDGAGERELRFSFWMRQKKGLQLFL